MIKKRPQRKLVSPKESVEGPDVNPRPEVIGDQDLSDLSSDRTELRPRPSFPTGAHLRRRIFSPRRKE